MKISDYMYVYGAGIVYALYLFDGAGKAIYAGKFTFGQLLKMPDIIEREVECKIPADDAGVLRLVYV